MFEPFIAKRQPRPMRKGRSTIDDTTFEENLTRISIDYAQRAEDFVHWQATPNVEVEAPEGKYKVWSRADSFRIDVQPRRPGEAASIRTRAVTTQLYGCEQFALAEKLPDEEVGAKDSILDEDVAVRDLTHNMLMDRERAWMAAYFGVAIWANNVVGTTDFTKWSSAAPVPLIFQNVMTWKDTIRRSCGMDPNVIVFSPDVWTVLRDDADIQDRISSITGGITEPRKVTKEMIAALFEVDYVLVARATRNTALEGAAMTGAFFASDSVLMMYRPDVPSRKVPSAGYCFSYTPYDNVRGDVAKSGAAAMLSWYENKEHSTYVEAQMYYVFKVVDSSAGLFASDVL
jgi:hypothetical protein